MSNRVGVTESSSSLRPEENELDAKNKDGCCGKLFGGDDSGVIFMKISGVIAGVAALVLIIVLPVYFAVIEPNSNPTSISTPPEAERFDCWPENDVTQEKCEERGCKWTPSTSDAPNCYYSGTPMYARDGSSSTTASGIIDSLQLDATNGLNHYGEQFSTLRVETQYISDSTIRVKISPEGVDRYEVPMDHRPATNPSNELYSAEHGTYEGRFGVKITRVSTMKVLFDTSIGELMFADQFIQISTRVASEYIYGFGEHMHESFKHNMNWKTYGMFSRDQGVGPNVNLYGVHPYFMCMEGDGNAYGVFFVNSNAMDVTLQPTPAITYRSVGGLIDFYIFLGPSPEQVSQQYTEVIGRPYFPPYWSLGFQLCRYGYENLANLSRVVNRNLDAGIPYEIQYSDIDYMERQLDFTIDNASYYGLEDFVKKLKNEEKMRYIIILDPAISGNETHPYPAFDDGVASNVFIQTPEGDIAWGKVWPDLPDVNVDTSKDWDYQTENYRAFAAFPDFYLPITSSWWRQLTVDFHSRIEFDGLWIDMNEPASFVAGSPSGCPASSKYDQPPYHPHLGSDKLYDKTLCMNSKQYHPKTMEYTEHYNMHSLFGLSQSPPTLDACRASTGERCIVISRSTYPGSGKYAGHWLGDNASIWEHLAASIIGMLEFNLFGIPYVGADVCGFFNDVTYELCLRWMQLGAFYPFDRNHNGLGWADQDPASFDQTFIDASKKVLETRYRLLPYLYTLFYEAHTTGSTVVRSLMNQFPKDNKTYTIDRQFLWGPALMITPVLDEGEVSVFGYIPHARCYHYESGYEIPAESAGTYVLFMTPLDHINLHVIGGNIIPTQAPNTTTYYSRQNPFGLIVALDSEYKSRGSLFWDDGTSIDTIDDALYTLIDFTCESSILTISVNKSAPPGLDVSGLHFEKISIFGLRDEDVNNAVTVGGTTRVEGSGADNVTYIYTDNVLEISELFLNLDEQHIIDWSQP